MTRQDGRGAKQLREIKLTRNCNLYAEGSCLVEWGNTKVLCTASVENTVPAFLRGTGSGWVTAEYSMLPRATYTRNSRERFAGKPNSRSLEIQRLIGRSLRAAVKLEQLGEYTVTIDCDVLQADGGTRTASITGGFVALVDALRSLKYDGKITTVPLAEQIAAVSCGKMQGQMLLDLCYLEDSCAEVDANFVMTGRGDFVEIQGTGEGGLFSQSELDELIRYAKAGVQQIMQLQRDVLKITEKEAQLLG